MGLVICRDGKENVLVFGTMGSASPDRINYRQWKKWAAKSSTLRIQAYLDGIRHLCCSTGFIGLIAKAEYYLGLENALSVLACKHELKDRGEKDLGLKGLEQRAKAYKDKKTNK